MKKKKLNGKLTLNKEVISNLNDIKGGGGKDCYTDPGQWSCTPTHLNCPNTRVPKECVGDTVTAGGESVCFCS